MVKFDFKKRKKEARAGGEGAGKGERGERKHEAEGKETMRKKTEITEEKTKSRTTVRLRKRYILLKL